MQFHEKLQRHCQMRGLSRRKLARQLIAMAVERGDPVPVSVATVGRWMTGDSLPDILRARDLAALLALSLDYLVNQEQDDPIPGQIVSSAGSPSLPSPFIRELVTYLGTDESLRRLLKVALSGCMHSRHAK